MLDRDKVSRPERGTAHIAARLSYYSIDVASLNETRLTDEDSLQEVVSGYMVGWVCLGFFWKRKPQTENSTLGFAIKAALLKNILTLSTSKNLLEYFKCYNVLCHL